MTRRSPLYARPGRRVGASPVKLLLGSLFLLGCAGSAGSPAPSTIVGTAAATPLAVPSGSPVASPGVAASSTYDRLCELARRYSSDRDTAEAMCDQLAIAERSEAEGSLKAEYRALDEFRAAVEAGRGTSLDVDEATELIQLLDRL